MEGEKIERMVITKVGPGNWRVSRKDPTADRPLPGVHKLEWEFAEGTPEDAKAYFQFTDPQFVEDIQGQHRLTEHWTASLESPTDRLQLKLKGPEVRRIHYAVWIDSEKVFAIGNNPPPKVDVGP